MLKKLFEWFKKDGSLIKTVQRSEHSISRDNISNNALKVLYRLHNSGFSAYLVGGCIRDLLLDKEPKDFDIVTNASPEEIKKLFTNCRLIGRRFRLAHVHFGREIIEVATFRAAHSEYAVKNSHGMILRDNVYGKIEEDVLRRDFTINALYYNIADFAIVDFVDGLEDLRKKQLSLIGDPLLRYREDPVRMLRAARFAAKLGFTISPKSAKPISAQSNLLSLVPPARLFEEYSKLFFTGYAYETYKMLLSLNLFKQLFPNTPDDTFISLALQNTDARVQAGKSVAPSFLLAVFNWYALCTKCKNQEFNEAVADVLREQQKIMAVPRRFVNMIRDVWELQHRLERRRTLKQVEHVFSLAKFRAAYDFLLLRAQANEKNAIAPAKWWQSYVEGDETVRQGLVAKLKSPRRKRKKPYNKNTATGDKCVKQQ